MKILVLGSGFQGKAAIHDLACSEQVSEVIAADRELHSLEDYLTQLGSSKIMAVELDATDLLKTGELMDSVQAVINLATVPESARALLAKLAIQRGVHWVDTSYAGEAIHNFHLEAREREITLLPEFGLDPGIDLVLAGCAIAEFDEVHEFYSYGSGVPEPTAADNPLKYKISWSFSKLLDTYTRPARVVKGRYITDIPADKIFAEEHIHIVDMGQFGPMEAYPNGEVIKYLQACGIERTVKNAGRYALRWPGHCAFWNNLAALGFLQDIAIEAGASSIAPKQFLHDLLEPKLQYGPEERDLIVIRVDVTGEKNGQRQRVIYEVIDYRDLETGLLAMQRTVGYTASIGAQMILDGSIDRRGVISPMLDVPAELFFAELRKRNIVVRRTEQEPRKVR